MKSVIQRRALVISNINAIDKAIAKMIKKMRSDRDKEFYELCNTHKVDPQDVRTIMKTKR